MSIMWKNHPRYTRYVLALKMLRLRRRPFLAERQRHRFPERASKCTSPWCAQTAKRGLTATAVMRRDPLYTESRPIANLLC